MSFNPIVHGTVKVAVTTSAQAVTSPSASAFQSVQVLNAGPSIIFVERTWVDLVQNAVVDQSMPIMPGVQVIIPQSGPGSSNAGISIIGQGSSTAYVTFGTGEISGLATLSAEA